MPEPGDRLPRLLRALLPPEAACELFEPASQDLRNGWLERRSGAAGPAAALLAALHALRLLALFVDCWCVAAAAAARRLVTPPPRHRAGFPPPEKERLAMTTDLLRQAFRRLRRQPAFALTALLTLALGVGANVAVFTVVEAALLRPLPFAEPDALVTLNHRDQRTGITKEFLPVADYLDLRARQRTFEAMSVYFNARATMVTEPGGEPMRGEALATDSELFGMLRLQPALGRGLRREDSRPGAEPVVVLGHDLWRTRFGGEAGALGRTLRVEGTERRIVGVAPPGIAFPGSTPVELVVPVTLPLTPPAQRNEIWVRAVGRLRRGVELERGAADLATVAAGLAREHPQTNQAATYVPLPLRDALLGDTRPALVLLFGAVGMVLLIACVNVANLVLARAVDRGREISVRRALGAGRGRLAAQLLAEGFALSLLGAVAGVALARWGAAALLSLLPDSVRLPALAARELPFGGPVLLFAVSLVGVITLLFGLVATSSARGAQPAGALAATTKASLGRGARRAMASFVVAEVALAVVLLFGAGLILRTFAGLLSTDPGFRTEDVATLAIELPPDRYGEGQEPALEGFYRRAFAELAAVPGVEAAGAGVVTPLTGNHWTVPLERADRPLPPGERPPEVGWQSASDGYFRALGIALVSGRLFDERDRAGAPGTVIVSEALQRQHFADGSAVGRRIRLGEESHEIVGVVGDVRRAGLQDEPRAEMYFPFGASPQRDVTLFVRTAGAPEAAVPAVEAALRRVEPGIQVTSASTMARVASESLRVTRLVFLLLGAFAAIALALAAVGIYGVMSYAVRARAREIGTRLAVGATAGDIVWLVLRQGGWIAGFGAAIGVAAGLAATRLLASVLHGVSPTDPATLAAALGVLGAAVAAACWLPARRAAALDPARTLADP